MPKQDRPRTPLSNRRASRRQRARGRVTVEYRRRAPGSAPARAERTLDISETGARLVLREPLAPGDAVELHIRSATLAAPLGRRAVVIWCLPTEGGRHLVGLRFDLALAGEDVQALAAPPRVLR